MKINTISLFSNINNPNYKFNVDNSFNTNHLNKSTQDVFIKSKGISFKARSSEQSNKVNISDTIIGGGLLGAAFLIPLILATAVAKHQNPDEIFLPDGTYLGKADELFVDKNKAEELGFNLDPSRFKGPNCVCDEINGVYKDFSKGIDINLKEGKYIDLDKGVFVKPDEETSVIFTKGDAMPVIIPNFGSGYPMRDEDIRNHDYTTDSAEIKDPMTILEKAKEFFCGEANSRIKHDYWGKEIVTVQDKAGNNHQVALTDDLSERMHNEHISYETAQAFLSHAAEHPIENYIKENFANYLNGLHFENPSVGNFIDHLSMNSGTEDTYKEEKYNTNIIHEEPENEGASLENHDHHIHNGLDDDISWLN